MENLIDLREKIDQLDIKILDLIKERLSLMRETGIVKKERQVSIRDKDRESEKINILQEKAKELKIPAELVKKIWSVFFESSQQIEK